MNNNIDKDFDDNDSYLKEQRKTEKVKMSKSPFILFIFLIIIIGVMCSVLITISKKNNKYTNNVIENNEVEKEEEINPLSYKITEEGIENFDLYFLKQENNKKNMVYSPLSIKYALSMLNEGTGENTKQQIANILGTYNPKQINNSQNVSIANALFVRNSFKDSIKDTYTNSLKTKYNAEVIYDSFKNTTNINNWVSNKTFKLINNIFNDVSDKDFILLNTLAIDMEWRKKIQAEYDSYYVKYDHRNYYKYISPLNFSYYKQLDFKDISYKIKSAEFGAVINKYDIIKDIGEDKIRETVGNEYKKWLDNGAKNACYSNTGQLDVNTYLNNYIKEINTGYNDISSSTDFEFYFDEDIKVFAKDLKRYDNVSLQYVAIMPENIELNEYIKTINSSDINNIINKLKEIKLENFKEGVITEITGYVPMFNFEYKLDLQKDLNKLGITDVFDKDKANLSNLTSTKSYINSSVHKTNIEFSNDGIKASTITIVGGKGGGDCGFDYLYDVPVEKIDLTFNKPYLFIIRDKLSKEVWFAGTVYKPTKFSPYEY